MSDPANNVLILITLVFLVWFTLRRMRNRQQIIQHREASEAFLKDNADKPGVEVTQSGLQYLCLEKGDGNQRPLASDTVYVHYHGTLIDGTVFDSSVERGQPIKFGLNQVIAGWTEGLQLMHQGDKFRLFIPAKLAYGNRSAGKIPGGSALIFDVELLAINP